MKALTVLAILLAAATPAVAQGMGMGTGQGGGPPLDDADFRPTVAQLQTLLDLTPEQATTAAMWRDSLVAETRGLRAAAQGAMADMRAAMARGVGADSMAVFRGRMQGAMMALMPARMRFMERLKSVLTKEQAATLDEHHRKQMEMMSGMHSGVMAPGCGTGKGMGKMGGDSAASCGRPR